MDQPKIRFLRRREVEMRGGFKRDTLYAKIADGLWTKGVPLSDQLVGWPEAEVEALNTAALHGRTKDEIRQLVVDLETARTGKPATPRRKKPHAENAPAAAAA